MKTILIYIALLLAVSQADPFMPTLGCSGNMDLAYIRVTYNFVEYSACLNKNHVVEDCLVFSVKKQVEVYGLALIEDLSCINCYNEQMFVAPTTSGVVSCIRDLYYVPNCVKYRKTGNIDSWSVWSCYECSPTLRVNGLGQCSPVVNRCSSYTPFGLCISCITNYELKGSVCVEKINKTRQKPVNPDEGCLTQVQTGNCPKCKPGYVFIERVCFSIKDKAKDIDTALGQCLVSEIRMQSGKCVQEVINCQQYNEEGLCLKCLQGFQFSDDLSRCEDISRPSVDDFCPDVSEEGMKYLLVVGKCVKVDSSCMEANEDGCLSCNEGYFMYNKKCYFISFEEILGQV